MHYFQALILLFAQALCQHSALKPTSNEQHPHINVYNKNVTVVTGETAILPCSVDYLGTYKVVWVRGGKTLTFDDRRIVADERISLERPFTREWNLHVRKVETLDAGMYMCQINTDPIQVRAVTLVVHEPPSVIDYLSTPSTVNVREHVTVELVCNVTGIPPPIVTWKRVSTGQGPDQGLLGTGTNIGMEGEVLVIHNVTRYCDDIYQCVANNSVLPAAVREIRVNVQYAPEITLAVKKIGQIQGKPTVLDCDVVANPHNLNGWRRNGIEVGKNPHYEVEAFNYKNKITLSLRINPVTHEDYGEFECYAENLFGSDSEVMILHETPKPTPKPSTTTELSNVFGEHGHHRKGQSQERISNNEDQNEHEGPSDPSYNNLESNQAKLPVSAKSSEISDPKRYNTASFSIVCKPIVLAAILVFFGLSKR